MSFNFFKKKNDVDFGVIDKDTPFAIREAYKALFSNILYLNIGSKCKKIAVTSAISGEGKTTVSANLAVTLAQNLEGKRVLLIDADMREPGIARTFSLRPGGHGLREYLSGIDEDPHFDYLPQHKLMVIPSGGRCYNPTKLIGSEKMQRLIKACENEFDYVIIDTPPVNIVSDAVLLNGIVDGYLISTHVDRSDLHTLNQCISKLERVGSEIFGIALSGVQLKGYDGKYNRDARKYIDGD